MTKFKIFTFLFIINLTVLWAQEYEFGVVAGGGNYIGDIGREYYFYPNKLGGGIVFKRTVNQWFSVRLNFNYFQIAANDAEAESVGRIARDFSTHAQLLHFAMGVEYNFIARNPFLTLQSIHKLTPYFFTGVGVGTYSGDLIRNTSLVPKNTNTGGYKFNGTNINIPMVLGIKYKAARHFIIAMEAGVYYYFTDNLDGSYSLYGNEDRLIKDGIVPTTNTHSNDWYSFTSISFIYTFGDLSCYFNLR